MITLHQQISCPTSWETINTGSGEFELLIKRPSCNDRLKAQAALVLLAQAERQGTEAQLIAQTEVDWQKTSAVVVDWKGIVSPENEPVPFSIEGLAKLIEQTGCLVKVLLVVYRAYEGEAPTKN